MSSSVFSSVYAYAFGLLLLCWSGTASAQSFRNNNLQFSAGWMALGTTTDALNQSFGLPWNATDQGTIGVGYMNAIGYNMWWVNDVNLGFGGALNLGAFAKTVVTTNVATGLRYNFLDEKIRPFVAGYFHYIQFFNTEGTGVQGNIALGGVPLWVGIRLGAGCEWVFAPEMAVQFEAAPIVFFNLDQPPKLSGVLKLAYNVYF